MPPVGDPLVHPNETVQDITPGGDGAMWFGEVNAIGRIDNAGNVTHFVISGQVDGESMTTGPNGTIWFTSTMTGINGMDTAGKRIGFYFATDNSSYGDLALGPDGSLWITLSSAQIYDQSNIRRIGPNGAILAEFTVSPFPNAITAGPGATIWFTAGSDKIGRIDANGVVTLFSTPTANSGVFDIISGPDGALWFTEGSVNKIGRITTSGVFTEYALPPLPPISASIAGGLCSPGSLQDGPNRLTAGPDGSIWFVEPCVNQIGRLGFAAPDTPTTGEVSPSQGSGTTGTFAFTFSDTAGWQNLEVVNVLINNALDGRKACYLAYSVPTSTLLLVDDAGDAGGPFAGSVMLGSSATIQNSQCTVSLISAAGSGNTLTLTLAVNFKAGLSGNLVQYVAARDSGFSNSGWQASGVWNSMTQTPPGTILVSALSPGRTDLDASQPLTLTFTVQDSKGSADMGVVNLLVNNFIDGRHACYLAYVPATNRLYLVDDAGDAGGPFAAMVMNQSSSVIQNSQCTIQGQGSSAVSNGTQLTLTLQISFLAPLAGNRIFWVAGRDAGGGNNTGWQALGTALIIQNQ